MRDGDGWGRGERVPRTKLLRPVVPPGVPLDDALVDRTARTVAATPITLITGQAGAGKTTLAVQATARTGLPVAWASFAADDDEVPRSLHLLVSAIATAVPEGCPGASELLRTDRPAAGDAPRAAAVLVNDVLAAEPPLFVLVLDDVHLLRAAAPFLAAVLAHLPPPVRVVMTSRVAPDVGLSRLRATRRLAEVGGDDLRLDVDQAASVLNDDIGLALPPDEVASVLDAVGGWATGVHMLGRSLSRHPEGGRGPGAADPATLFDYLADEVLVDEPDDVVALLADVAVLSVVTPEAARGVTGRDDAAAVLADVARRLHFLVLTVDGPGQVFRLHDLIRQHLLRRRAATEPDVLAARHRRAADVVSDPGARIEHLIAAGAWEEAADAVAAAARAVAPRSGELARVAAWAARIPVGRPWLSLAEGVSAVGRGDRDGALERLGPLVVDEGFDDVLGRWLAARTLHIATLDHERWAPQVARLGALPEFASLPTAVRVDHEVGAAYGAMFSERWDAARQHVIAALDMTMATGDPASIDVLAEHLSPLIACADGCLDHIETYVDWVEGRRPEELSLARLGLLHQQAMVAFLRGRAAEAADAAARGRVVLERLGGSPHLRATFDWAEVAGWLGAGDLDRAEALLRRRQEEPAATELDRRMDLFQLPTWAWVLRLQGRLDEVVAVARRPLGGPRSPSEPALVAARASLAAQGAWAAGDMATAVARLEEASAIEDVIRAVPLGISPRMALALAREAAGDPAGADREAATALRAAATYGTPGLLVAGREQVPVLRRAIARGVVADVASTVLAGQGSTTAASAPVIVPSTGEVLSAREVEVLRLVAEGASNRQVAEALYISEHTVKTHVRRLLAKLDARSRGHAAAVARDHRLV